MFETLTEPVRAYWARKRLERLQYEAAAGLFKESGGSQRVDDDPDFNDWRLIHFDKQEVDDDLLRTIRDRARDLVDRNPYARNVINLYRNYVVGNGMRHEVIDGTAAGSLWNQFLTSNEWAIGNRKDWEFCSRTWRDGECFLQLFRMPNWPPRVHFVDPEDVVPDSTSGLPTGGIETEPGNVEQPVAYFVSTPSLQPLSPKGSGASGSPLSPRGKGATGSPLSPGGRGAGGEGSMHSPLSPRGRGVGGEGVEIVSAARILHTKIGVDANVKRGVSIFRPVLESLKKFQGWLDVELTHRKMASSIVWIRKHEQNNPAGIRTFADNTATTITNDPLFGPSGQRRKWNIEPGTVIDAQGFDLQNLTPKTNFDDGAILGRFMLLSIAAGTGLPEYMLTADASNANFSSTLVAEGPAMKNFSSWQTFFIGQWQKLFQMVMREAVSQGRLSQDEAARAMLRITPPELPTRNRLEEAQADAIYFDRGAISQEELARRDRTDPELMKREKEAEGG